MRVLVGGSQQRTDQGDSTGYVYVGVIVGVRFSALDLFPIDFVTVLPPSPPTPPTGRPLRPIFDIVSAWPTFNLSHRLRRRVGWVGRCRRLTFLRGCLGTGGANRFGDTCERYIKRGRERKSAPET